MSAAGAIRDAARAMSDAPPRLARAGADAMIVEIETQLARDTGGDRRLSGLGRQLGVDVEIRPSGSGAEATITAPGAGWAILEHGTRPHTITAKRNRRSRAVNVEGVGWRTGPIRVSGARAKRTYSIGVTRGLERAVDAQHRTWEQINGS